MTTRPKTEASIHALEDARAEQRKLVQPQRPDRARRAKFAGTTPEKLKSVITQLERGRTEKWADLCETMRRDHHVRAVSDTRSLAIAGATPEVTPADDTPLADAAAEFCRNEAATSPAWMSTLAHLVTAEEVGWSAAQHVWKRRGGEWHSAPVAIESRDIAFATDWSLVFRTYDDEHVDNGRWLAPDELPSRTLMPHVPTKGMRPTISGDYQAVAWPWLFRRWCELFRQEGLEKFASPFITGKVPANAPEVVRSKLKAALEALSGDQVAVMEEGTSIELTEAAQRPGDAWTEAINAWNREVSKALLGSDLNVEVGSTGGNRALGESQFSTTILPRLTAIAKRLAYVIQEFWFRPLLELNAHRFGGVVPPVPTLALVLVNEEPPEFDEADINAGLRVTQNEYRAARGLDPLDVSDGGEDFLEPAAPAAAPGFSSSSVTGGEEASAAPAVPFDRRRRTSKRGRRAQTISDLATRTGRALTCTSASLGK